MRSKPSTLALPSVAAETASRAETQRNARESAALAEVGRDLSSTLDLATVMDRIASHAKQLLGALGLTEPGAGSDILSMLLAARDEDGNPLSEPESSAATSASSQRSVPPSTSHR